MVNKQKLTIATRKSPLALWQARHVQTLLTQTYQDNLIVNLLPLETEGDQKLDTSLSKIGGKGLFVKRLEQALLDNSADIAVHSLKDVPMCLPPGLCLTTILPRQDPRDVLVSPQYNSIAELPPQAKVGTSSLRRQCQLLNLRPDLNIVSLRGNVQTRLNKLLQRDLNGIILAAAGLQRLKLEYHISEYLLIEHCLPAVGQGVIAIECRTDDTVTQKLLSALHDPLTEVCITAERTMNATLEGSCQAPIAGHADMQQDKLILSGIVGTPNGKKLIRKTASQPISHHANKTASQSNLNQAKILGQQIASELLNEGADKILADLIQTH